jgi:aryl-alcohol dehydrogenase
MDFTAAVLHAGTDRMAFETVELQELRDDEVLVRLVASGICHSDVLVRDGAYPIPRPLILGHEGSGIVERVGAGVATVSEGDHVVLTFTSCGRCRRCEADEPAYCHDFRPLNASGFRADGTTALKNAKGQVGAHFFGQSSFAAYSVANVRNVVKVRNDAPLHLIGPFGCGVQTGAGAVINSLRAKKGETLVVLGGGAVGLSAVMAGVLAGCSKIIVSEPNAERRKLAPELGATDVIDPTATEDLTAEIMRLTGIGADMVLDTSGIPAVVEAGYGALGPHGRLGVVAFQGAASSINVSLLAAITLGRQIIGICEGDAVPGEFIPFLIDRFMEGRLPIDKMVKCYTFNQLNEALDDQAASRTLKPIVLCA